MATSLPAQFATLSRRDFIGTSAALAGLGALGSAEDCGAAARDDRLLVSIRDAHLKVTGKPDCWAALATLGVDGVEVEVNEQMVCYSLFHPEKKYELSNEDGVRVLQADLNANRKTITAFCMHNRLEEQLEREIAWTAKLVAAAARLKVPVIRIDVAPNRMTREEMLPFAISACRRMCELAKDTNVRFGIENHGRLTNDPAFLDRLFAGVDSPRLGLTFDAMNFYWYGHPLEDLYSIYEKLAPRTFHTHCKNLRYPEERKNVRRPMGWEYEKHAAPLYAGDIDYTRVTRLLRKSGYRGDLCLENECLGHFPKEAQAEVLKKEVALLRSLA